LREDRNRRVSETESTSNRLLYIGVCHKDEVA
jgi:hypothetical protein